MQVDAKCLVDGADDLVRGDRSLGGIAADVVGLADDLAALDAAAGEIDGPAVRPRLPQGPPKRSPYVI